MLQPLMHYGIHVIVPLIIAYQFFRPKWTLAFVIMLSAMLIDFDHLLATPIFNPNRCSINFHPLHSYVAIGIYILLLFPKKTRLLGLGFCIHILADWVDCMLM